MFRITCGSDDKISYVLKSFEILFSGYELF